LRRRAGLSLEELADRSEIERGELDAILDGTVEARFDTISRLAGALRVDPGDLFN
jgi:transcriptional regulator with XRE-family HTH domain